MLKGGVKGLFVLVVCMLASGLSRGNVIPESSDLDLILKKIEDISEKQQVDSLNAYAFDMLFSHPSDARVLANMSMEIAESKSYLPGHARSLAILGSINWSAGDFTTAMTWYLKSLELYQTLKDPIGEAIIYNNMAELYKQMREYEKSISYHLKSLQLKKQYLSDTEPTTSYNNLGEVYFLLGKTDSSLYYYDRSKISARKYGNSRMEGFYHLGMARILLTSGQYGLANSHLDSARVKMVEAQNTRGLIQIGLSRVELYVLTGDYQSAAELLTQQTTEARKRGHNDLYITSLEKQVRLDSTQQNWPAAVQSYHELMKLSDSISSQEHNRYLAQLQKTYSAEKSIKENELLKQESAIKNMLIFIIALVAFTLILLVVAIYNRFKIKARMNEKLRRKSEVIERKNREIERNSRKLEVLNQNLETLVKLRTEKLMEQNKKLSEYAFLNSHRLRAPMASILGIIEVLRAEHLGAEGEQMILHLQQCTCDLKKVTEDINHVLEEIEQMIDLSSLREHEKI